MKLGVCCGTDRLHLLREIGYDYAEGYFAGMALCEESDFRKACKAQKNAEIAIEAFNGIFTGDVRLLGQEKTSIDYIKEFLNKGFFRAKTLGGEIAVFGSGKARSIPDGMEKERVEEEFLSLLQIMGEIARKNDMKLAIEPLRRQETNFINTVEEGLSLSRRAENENIGCIIDFFHFYSNGESLDSLKNAQDKLFHAHIARPNPDRTVPTEIDREGCRPWADTLRAIGYEGRLSIEAIFHADFEDDIRNAYPILQMFRNS